MEDAVLKNLEFYKCQFEQEYERSRYYDKIIQYPTTLIVFLIGGSVYAFNRYFYDGTVKLCSTLDWTFAILMALFAISIIISAFFLFYVFHGFTRKYDTLPFASSFSEYEKKLFIYYFRYNNETSRTERYEFAKNNTCHALCDSLKQYYISSTNVNQVINDKRALFYFRTRSWLFVTLILFLFLAIIGFTK